MDGLGPLFAHEIIDDANAVLVQITNHALAGVYQPLHIISALCCLSLPVSSKIFVSYCFLKIECQSFVCCWW
jgi:hypothetical protein